MRARGFTLVEVMVALAVVAIAVPALLVALYQQIDNTGYLRDRTLAQMVASNRLAEMRLVIAATRELNRDKADGRLEFADREWFWRSAIEPTGQVPNFFRLEVAVATREGEDAEPLYTLVAFMSADVRTAQQIARSEVTNPGDDQDPGEDNDNNDAIGNDNDNNDNNTNLPGVPINEQQELIDAIQNAQ